MEAKRLIAPCILLVLGAVIWLAREYGNRRRQRALLASLPAGAPPPPPRASRGPWRRGILTGVGMAALYLLLFRGISMLPAYNENKGGAVLMSFAFLFLGPFISGVITVSRGTRAVPWTLTECIINPWIAVAVNIVLALSVAWEGLICAVFIVPPAMIAASLGGLLAGAMQQYLHSKTSQNTVLCLAAVPLLLAVAEVRFTQPLETRTVSTSILIHAPAQTVWQNIERVPAIAPSELGPSWANTIGFPRPVQATLSYEGVGGVRNASFERGLNFIETVTDWQPLQRIAFTIRADTAAIPSTTLDEHVTVGGRFFDVLTGEYDLQPQPNGDTLLHLSSQERLSTDFNLYAALWSDAVMSDMQNNILRVVRNRCEAQARTTTASVTINHKGN